MNDSTLISIARTELEKASEAHTNISSYGCVSIDGKVFIRLNYACHAMCQGEMYSNKAHIMFSVTGDNKGVPNPPLSLEERSMYHSWLCSKSSPFAEVLHNEYNNDSNYVAENGVIITNLSVPRNLMVAALAATRACKEHPPHVRMFCKLVNSGVFPRFAFFLAGMACQDSSDRVYYGMRSNTNHWPLWPEKADEEYVLNFLRGIHYGDKPFNVYDGQRPYSETTSVGGAWFNGVTVPKPLPSQRYLEQFRTKAKAEVDKSGFTPMKFSDFDKFLKTALAEQERLYAII